MVTLSEYESKRLLGTVGIPVCDEAVAVDPATAGDVAESLGFPVAVKLCGPAIRHKSERGLLALGCRTRDDVVTAGTRLLAAAEPEDGAVELLVSRMVSGRRELIAGVQHDPQFGPVAMLGIGGVLTEAVHDVTFRLLPVEVDDAASMAADLQLRDLLGPARGEPGVDLERLGTIIVALGDLLVADDGIRSIDVNPLLVDGHGDLVAVDALVERA